MDAADCGSKKAEKAYRFKDWCFSRRTHNSISHYPGSVALEKCLQAFKKSFPRGFQKDNGVRDSYNVRIMVLAWISSIS